MKKTDTIFSCALAAFIATGALCAQEKPVNITPQDFNKAVNGIQEKHKVRYLVYNDAEVVKDLKEYFKTDGLNQGQKNEILRRMARSAANINDSSKTFETVVALVESQEKQNDRNNIYSGMINDFTGTYASNAQFAEAEKIAVAQLEKFDVNQQLNALTGLAWRSVKQLNDKARLEKYSTALLKLEDPNAKDDNRKKQFERRKDASLVRFVSAIAEYSLEEAAAFFKKYATRFDDGTKCDIIRELAKGAISAKDRTAFDIFLKQIVDSPVSDARLNALNNLASQFSNAGGDGEKILLDELRKNASKYTPNQLFNVYRTLADINRVFYFIYGFNTPGRYEKYMEYMGKAFETAKSPDFKTGGFLADAYGNAARAAVDFGDAPKGREFASAALKLQNGNYNRKMMYAEAFFNFDRAGSISVLEEIASNEKENINNRAHARAIIYFAKGNKCDGFDAAFADMKYTSAQKMTAMRRAGEFMFRTGAYDMARGINDWIVKNMFRQVENKKYKVIYDADCPKTADGFVRSRYYNDWKKMETRFEPYGDGFGMDQTTDEKWRLKDAEIPGVKDEFRTGVFIAYSDEGIHIFVQMLDPDVREVELGKHSGGSLECLLKPGTEAAYHSWYFENLPGTDEPHLVNWGSPTRNYKLTYDFFKKDAVTSKDGLVAHTYIPWMMFHNKLPLNGNKWIYGLQAWGRQALTLSGTVHEQARALELIFDFTPEQLLKLKRNVAVTAFNKYNSIRRNRGGMLQTWNDPLLGDPEFYKSELEGLITDLDKAGEMLMSPAPDSSIDAIYSKYVPLWAEIEYEVADRRAKYLRNDLLSESRVKR